jgi:putative endonuclease
MKHYVYILYSEKTNKYYVGSCEDVYVRLQRHNAGSTTSTKSGRPWIVQYTEELENKTQALIREKYIKSMKSRIYIESLISQSQS